MKTLDQLIEQLSSKVYQQSSLSVFELFPLVNAYTDEDWKTALTIENHKPKNTLLFQDEYMKMLLIHWDSFQQSSKHGHPGGGGLVKVLSGTLVESLFDSQNPDKMIGKHRLSTGNISFVHDDIAHHMVENPSRQSAISLHIYAPAIYVPGFAPVQNTLAKGQMNLRKAA